MNKRLSYHLKQYMIADVTPEFKNAMFSLNSNKAHGPDGFSADLFKKSWNIVGEDAVAAVISFNKESCLQQ